MARGRGRSKQATQREVAKVLEEWMETQPLDRISIGDLTERTGMSRQMFYHYFRDRNELTRWLCENYIHDALYKPEIYTWEGTMLSLLVSEQEHGKQYRTILNSRFAQSFDYQLQKNLHELYYNVIRYRICHVLPEQLDEMVRRFVHDCAKLVFAFYLSQDDENRPKKAGVTAVHRAVCRKIYSEMPRQLREILCDCSIPFQKLENEQAILNWFYNSTIQ